MEHLGGEESEYNFWMRRFMVETASILASSPRGSIIVSDASKRPTSPSLAISSELGRDVMEDTDQEEDTRTVTYDISDDREPHTSTTKPADVVSPEPATTMQVLYSSFVKNRETAAPREPVRTDLTSQVQSNSDTTLEKGSSVEPRGAPEDGTENPSTITEATSA